MNDPIRAALERFVTMADMDLICPGNPAETDWGAVTNAIAEARAALAKRDPLRRHCAEILQLWDADYDIDMAMEFLRGMLSEEVQP